jgi:hypothetical protein
MKRRHMQWVLAGVSLAIILICGSMITSPILYSAENASSTAHHADPSLISRTAENRAGSVVPAMDNLIESTGTIVLNIKNKDFKAAQTDLESYMAASRSFNSLIVNLDLSESEIGEFVDINRENIESLSTLFEESKRFEEISSLEVVYRDEENPEALYSVAYEGEALRMKMEEAYQRYAAQQSSLQSVSSRYGLSTASYNQSVTEFAAVVGETEAAQESRLDAIPKNDVFPLILGIEPTTATFGDRILIAGTLYRSPGQEVGISIDSRLWGTAVTDINGRYAAYYPVTAIGTGKHLIYTSRGSRYSDVIEFTIVPAPAALTLEATQGDYGAGENVLFTGTLSSLDRPVSNALVSIVPDEGAAIQVLTDEKGVYSCTGLLDPGIREVKAVVSGESLPFAYTASSPVTVDVPHAWMGFASLVMKGAVILVLGLGLEFMVRSIREQRSKRRATPISRHEIPVLRQPALPPAPIAEPLSPAEVARQYALHVGNGDYREAIRTLYLALAGRIGRKAEIRNYIAWTPREILGATSGASEAKNLAEFIGKYEHSHYGTTETSHGQAEALLRWYGSVTEAMGGGQD